MAAKTLSHSRAPLYQTLGEVTALWAGVNLGYYVIFPVLGISLSYNSAPTIIALYYFFWFVCSVYIFWDVFERWVVVDKRIWHYAAVSLIYSAGVWTLLYWLSTFPTLLQIALPAYTDILFATPWYFLPKAIEILVQQTLITALILVLQARFHSIQKVSLWYAALFGGAHVLLYAINDAPTPYATIMTAGAILSALVFPYFIIRLRSGFVYSYMVHLLFYIVVAIALHTWPPPIYSALQ